MKKATKILSVVLTMVMLVSALPVIAGATADNTQVVRDAYDITLFENTADSSSGMTTTSKASSHTSASKTEENAAWPTTSRVTAASENLPDAEAHGNVFKLEMHAPTTEDPSVTTYGYGNYIRMLNGTGTGTAQYYVADDTTAYKEWASSAASAIGPYLKEFPEMVQKIKLSMDFYIADEDLVAALSFNGRASIQLNTDKTKFLYVTGNKHSTPLLQVSVDKQLITGNSTSGYRYFRGIFETDRWNSVAFYIDSARGTYDFELNGEVIDSDIPLSPNMVNKPINRLDFSAATTKEAFVMYADNFKHQISSEFPRYREIQRIDFENYKYTGEGTPANGTVIKTINATNYTEEEGVDYYLGGTHDSTTLANPALNIVYNAALKSNVMQTYDNYTTAYFRFTDFQSNDYYKEHESYPDRVKLSFKLNTEASTSHSCYVFINGYQLLRVKPGKYELAYILPDKSTATTVTSAWTSSQANTGTANVWHDYDLYIQFSTSTVDVYIDKVYIGSMPFRNKITTISNLGFTDNRNTSGAALLVDDITLSVPEYFADENIHDYVEYAYGTTASETFGGSTQLERTVRKIGFAADIEEGATETFKILEAKYDKQGNLTDVSISDEIVLEGNGEGVYNLTALPEGSTAAKYFFWKDTTTSLKPIFEAKKLVK